MLGFVYQLMFVSFKASVSIAFEESEMLVSTRKSVVKFVRPKSGDRSEMLFSQRPRRANFVNPESGDRSVMLLSQRVSSVKFVNPESREI